MINTFQKGDVLAFIELGEFDKTKILKFTAKYYNSHSASYLNRIWSADDYDINKLQIVYHYDRIIEKANPPITYSVISIKDKNTGISCTATIPVKYLKLIYRNPRHKLTGIFSDFWKPGNFNKPLPHVSNKHGFIKKRSIGQKKPVSFVWIWNKVEAVIEETKKNNNDSNENQF